MLLQSSDEDNDPSVGTGWTYDVPRLVNQRICGRFLKALRDKICSTPGFNVEEVTADSGYFPYSTVEWNDVVAESYVTFVCQGVQGEKAILYKTTASRRNSTLGEYYVFDYNANEPPNPNPIAPVIAERRERNGRTFPDLFWTDVCTAEHLVEEGGHQVSINIMIRVVLVGSLLLKGKPQLLPNPNLPDTVNQDVRVTIPFQREVFGMEITPSHLLSNFFRDFDSFKEFVRNGSINHWRFKAYPDYAGESESKQTKMKMTVNLCKDFQLNKTGDGFSEELEGQISNVIRGRNLKEILSMGLTSMNDEYVDYILRIREQYQNSLWIAYNREIEEGGGRSYVQLSKILGSEYRNGDREFV